MEVSISQKNIYSSVRKGAMAALSQESQKDKSGFSRLFKSVKIKSSDKEIVIESGNKNISTKFTLPFSKEKKSEFVVKDSGSVYVPAKELLEWLSNQDGTEISLKFVPFKRPEIIKDASEISDYGGGNSVSIKKVGDLMLSSNDGNKAGSEWSVECYDSDHLSEIKEGETSNPILKVPFCQLETAIKSISFAHQKNDYKHIFDSVSIEKYKNDIYFSASDTHRCCLYKMTFSEGVDDSFFQETEMEGGKISFGKKLLIPFSIINRFTKDCGGEKTSFYFDDKTSRIYLSSGSFTLRFNSVGTNSFEKFPSIALLVSKKYNELCSVNKKTFSKMIKSASMVNGSSLLFDFKKEGGGIVKIHAISNQGKAKNISTAPVFNLSDEVKSVWGVSHLSTFMKVVDDDEINILVPEDLKSVKMVSDLDKNIEYLSMSIRESLYERLK